ncbi:MAG: Protein-L-isoaspartate O-methyltransferase [Alphaproteobacteria bacterium MarineAlpha5_Bin9]|nr:MAG: Protein-L-isoaspartate O-methyltransferase [Alphaproteobacteria bacterium MarineAlpha5_Bin9]
MVDVRKIRLILDLREAGISNSKVLSALEKIPREKFIPNTFRNQAYENIALPIGEEQTISQPYIVALMTEMLNIEKHHKILELGTGSGYQTCILSLLSRRVYSIERIKKLLIKAENMFNMLKLTNIVTKHGDGNLGWPEQIPFDRIIFTAATKAISENIFNHISNNGIIIAPIISHNSQKLKKFTKKDNEIVEEDIENVLFVPNLSGIQN